MTELAAAALDLAAHKLPVFPIWSVRANGVGFVCACPKGSNCTSPGKHPMVPHGVTQATTDIDRVSYWWRSRPDANIGLATGTVVVIDTDPRHGGEHALAELESKHYKLPPPGTSRPEAVASTSISQRRPGVRRSRTASVNSGPASMCAASVVM